MHLSAEGITITVQIIAGSWNSGVTIHCTSVTICTVEIFMVIVLQHINIKIEASKSSAKKVILDESCALRYKIKKEQQCKEIVL